MAVTTDTLRMSDVEPLIDFITYVSGRTYQGFPSLATTGGSAPGNGSIRTYPIVVKKAVTISALALRIGTLSAGGNIQAAIYANDPATMRPTGPGIVSTGSLSTASAGIVSGAVSATLQPGIYWFASNSDNGTSIPTSISAASTFGAGVLGSATLTSVIGATQIVAVSIAQTFGTWPDLTAATFVEVTTSAMPIVAFTVA